MVYEVVLLFGVLFIAAWLFSTLLQQRHALYLRSPLQDWLFLVLGLYFAWFWSHGGQTLAMKTWRIRLLTHDGKPVPFWRAAVRYVLAWMWFLPGLALAWLLGAKSWMMVLIPSVNVALWALAVYLDPDRQFLHDRMAGTRLTTVPSLRTDRPD
jgi:uncharacterized RDD family membrane protein YckC